MQVISPGSSPTTAGLVKKAKECGASLAGIVSAARLVESPSYVSYGKAPYYENDRGPHWTPYARSLLVIAVAHDPAQPQLDWWNSRSGGTPGNRRLIQIAREMARWAKEKLALDPYPLSYYVDEGGVLLKGAAALAGLGLIGRNNLLITPEYGPRVRLRALYLDAELEPTGPATVDPCSGCDRPCWGACPQTAFEAGSYHRDRCAVQMKLDEANRTPVEGWGEDGSPGSVIEYCRACESACPAGVEE